MAKVFIEETTLTAIGDAIRGKTGKTDLIDPANMDTEIANIPAGGGSDDVEPVVLTGNCERACSGPVAAAFIENFPTKVSTKDVIEPKHMFYKSTLSRIPFDINCQKNSNITMSYMFSEAQNLTSLPKVLNAKPASLDNIFAKCYRLKSIPDDWTDTWDWSRFDTMTSAYSGSVIAMFSLCYALRKVPADLLAHANPIANSGYTIFNQGFYNCYALDSVENMPIPYTVAYTSNLFQSTFSNCYRLKNFTFALDNGAPKVVSWKGQTIGLASNLGIASYGGASSMLSYSDITADKEVKDDATYQALKDDPDWWTQDPAYSRFNHDSAVATINSLPDTSAYLAANGGTNTITFKGENGSKTDGGAVNTLTEAEIAVAAAKGWTVTLY